jgi:hypothetical protein
MRRGPKAAPHPRRRKARTLPIEARWLTPTRGARYHGPVREGIVKTAGRRRRIVSVVQMLLVATSLAAAGPVLPQEAWAQAAKATAAQRRELDRKAQLAFVAGRYQEAIDLFTQLYLDFGDAEYLRNLGRCHQRNRDPDKAIASFDEYLLKAKNLSAAERDEVKGFIREMEELKRRQAETGAPLPPAPQAPAPASPPPPLEAQPLAQAQPVPAPQPGYPAPPGQEAQPAYPTYPPPASSAPPPPDASANAMAPPPAAAPSSTGRTVSYVLMGLGAATLVGAGVVTAMAWSDYNQVKKDNGDCRVYSIVCRDAADRVAKKNTTAKILYGVGGGLAAAGVVVFFVSPSPAATAQGRNGLAFNLAGRF